MPAPVDEVRNQLELLARHRVECVIIGGVAAVYYGVSEVTHDLDVCYSRDRENLEKTCNRAQVRECLFARRTTRHTLHFGCGDIAERHGTLRSIPTLAVWIYSVRFRAIGGFADVIEDAEPAMMFGHKFRILSLPKLIAAKRAAGRTKDLRALPELEAICEYRRSQGEL